uniref:Solute carrier family 22 member 2 n=1 Tax=Salarias fasciatus TaxID=181472 RepID=A0A672HPN9_SALFA
IWFLRVSVLLCLLSLSFAGVYVGAVFQAFTPEHRCRDPAAAERAERCGWSPAESRRLTPPAANGTGEPRSGCLRYDRDWNQVDCRDLEPEPSGTPITACQGGWEYDYQGRTSVVTEFHLVCGDAWLVDWFQSTLNIGFLISSFVFGYIADRFGRKICILVANAGTVASSLALAAVSSYPPILLLRTLLGFSAKGSWMTGYVMITEMVGVSHRRAAGMVYQLFFSLGLLVLSLLAFLIPDWRWLHAVSSAPYAFFLLYYWLTPESPRWLLSQNKMAEAVTLIHAVAKENKRKLGNTFQVLRKTWSKKLPSLITLRYCLHVNATFRT